MGLMPPKVLRRPGVAGGLAAAKAKAAAKARVRGGAKAKPKAGPRRGALRRLGGDGGSAPVAVFSVDKFDQGEVFPSRLVPVELWSRGLKIVVEEGVYWDCGQAGDRWRKASGEDGPEGNPVRRSGEVEGVFPFNFVGGGPVPPRLSKDFERWLVACHQSEEVASGQGGSLDEEFRGNRRETGGRAEQIEGKSRGPGEPQEARRRRERKGEEQYVRRKLKKEEGQEAEEKEKGEGQERRKRRKCQENPRVKGSFRGLRKHRTRPRLSGPAQSGQEGKEDCQKEGKTFFVKLKRKQQQLQRRGAFRLRAFRTRGQSEGCVASGSRSADLQYVGADANCASPTEWPTLGCPEGSIATSLQPILAADFRFQGKSPYEQGNADPELHSGSAAARKGVECCGRDHPTPQEFGADCFRRRLSGEPQTGASTFRCKFDEQHQGDDGSIPTPERGAESKERGEAALGETTKRRLAPMGQRERKERRWSQRRERRWQEGKEQGRRKRGDSEERGCKKVMPEDVAMPKKRISPSPEHGGDIFTYAWSSRWPGEVVRAVTHPCGC